MRGWPSELFDSSGVLDVEVKTIDVERDLVGEAVKRTVWVKAIRGGIKPGDKAAQTPMSGGRGSSRPSD